MKKALRVAVGLLVMLAVVTSLALAARPAKQTEPPQGYKAETVKLQTLKDKPGGVSVGFALLPGQWKGGELWSNWGDAIQGSDGNFYCSYGDHASKHGHSFVVKVDPKAGTAEVVVDMAKAAGLTDTAKYASGKIHGPLVEHKGWLYFAGYRGAEKYTTDEFGYDGDPLMRYNLQSKQVENLGSPVKDCSYPVYQVVEREGRLLLYGMTTPGMDVGGRGKAAEVFFVYDIDAKKLIFQGQEALKPSQARAFITTPDGRAYYSTAEGEKGRMVKYDPATNKLTLLAAEIPGDGSMRAASRVDSKGVAYGITPDFGVVFAFDTKTETVKPIGDVIVWQPDENAKKKGSMYAYTAVAKLDPTERYLYVVPRSHGGAQDAGCPVVRIDVQTGKKETVCKLLDAVQKEKGYVPIGSFGTALSADGKQMLIVWNGCDPNWAKPEGIKYSYADNRWSYPIMDVVSVTLLQLP